MRDAGDRPHVAVVGTGPCGAMAATRLLGHGVRVTVLEAGRRRPAGLVVRAAGNTVVRFRSTRSTMSEGAHVASLDPSAQWYRNISLGGLSNDWTGAVPRFAAADFTDGARLHERYRWPVSYDELVPYYESVEAAVVVSGMGRSTPDLPANSVRHEVALPDDWAAAASAIEPRGFTLVPIPLAKGSPWMVALRGTEFNSYTQLLRPVQRNPQLRIVRGARVRCLSWSPALGRVDAVEYVDADSNATLRLPVDAVVLAAGALGSTRILQSSLSPDFPRGIGGTHGVLGRYLHDHPREWWTFDTSRAMTLPHHPAYLVRADHELSEPLMASSCTIGLASQRDRVRTFARGRGTRFGVQVFGTMIPDEDCSVSLSTDHSDEDGTPMLDIGIRYDDRARANMAAARQRLADMFDAIGSRITMPQEFPPLLPGSSVHYGGTARMHDSPEYGVLDRWNSVHDAPNVVVCDASCFTTGPEKNPTLTAMALAARAADRLADDLAT